MVRPIEASERGGRGKGGGRNMAGLTRSTRRRTTVNAAASLGLGIAVLPTAGRAAQPYPWQLGMQAPATPVAEHIQDFHDVLLWIIFAISAFVLLLLLYVMVRFHHSRSPNPTRTSHNPVIEILWTVIPVLILVAIAVPSFKLMYYMDEVPKADMTVKIIGNQWFWHYDYTDQKIAFDSNMLAEKDLKPGDPRLLSVDNPLVVPVGATVRAQIAGAPDGVIHSWFVPSFGVQEYAVPGRLNETWFRIDKPGTYYGECNQICGINHSRMPIEIQALAKPDYEKWLAAAKTKFAAAEPGDAGPACASLVAGKNQPAARLAGN